MTFMLSTVTNKKNLKESQLGRMFCQHFHYHVISSQQKHKKTTKCRWNV